MKPEAENPALCAECGGECCKLTPGLSSPDDWGLPGREGENLILEALDSGKYCMDWKVKALLDEDYAKKTSDLFYKSLVPFESASIPLSERIYYVLPTVKHELLKGTPIIFSRAALGTCNLWTKERGCELTFENRPKQCRLLIPGEVCRTHPSSQTPKILAEWLSHQALFHWLINWLGDENGDKHVRLH